MSREWYTLWQPFWPGASNGFTHVPFSDVGDMVTDGLLRFSFMMLSVRAATNICFRRGCHAVRGSAHSFIARAGWPWLFETRHIG